MMRTRLNLLPVQVLTPETSAKMRRAEVHAIVLSSMLITRTESNHHHNQASHILHRTPSHTCTYAFFCSVSWWRRSDDEDGAKLSSKANWLNES